MRKIVAIEPPDSFTIHAGVGEEAFSMEARNEDEAASLLLSIWNHGYKSDFIKIERHKHDGKSNKRADSIRHIV